jgi:hypothetical protein
MKDLNQQKQQLLQELHNYESNLAAANKNDTGVIPKTTQVFVALEMNPKEKCIDTLMAIRKMLAPGGSYIVMVPNAQSHTGVYWMYEDFTHYLLFTAGSLTYALQSAGFNRIEFLDPKCLKGLSAFGQWKRKILLRLYEIQLNFWNRVTASSFHKPSPRIYSFELKAKAGV